MHQNMISDKGGRGVSQYLIFGWQRGRGCLDPPILADIICEQPISTFAVYFTYYVLLAWFQVFVVLGLFIDLPYSSHFYMILLLSSCRFVTSFMWICHHLYPDLSPHISGFVSIIMRISHVNLSEAYCLFTLNEIWSLLCCRNLNFAVLIQT